MTLIEVTVMLVVLFMFLGLTAIGARSWKRGSDRAGCVLNICQTQKAVRSFANMNGLSAGVDTAALRTPIDMKAALVGPGGYMEVEPTCPGQGAYEFGGDVIPPIGKLYLSCSLASTGGHVPKSYRTW